MGGFNISAARAAPYLSYRFRLRLEGRLVAGVSKVSKLQNTDEVFGRRNDANASGAAAPVETKLPPITLERGVTYDREFEAWANAVWQFGSTAQTGDGITRKDLILELYNEAGQLASAYTIRGAWVSEFQPLPDLDANMNAVAIHSMKLEHEGWEPVEVQD